MACRTQLLTDITGRAYPTQVLKRDFRALESSHLAVTFFGLPRRTKVRATFFRARLHFDTGNLTFDLVQFAPTQEQQNPHQAKYNFLTHIHAQSVVVGIFKAKCRAGRRLITYGDNEK